MQNGLTRRQGRNTTATEPLYIVTLSRREDSFKSIIVRAAAVVFGFSESCTNYPNDLNFCLKKNTMIFFTERRTMQ